MINYMLKIANSYNPNTYILQNLFLIALIALIYHIYKIKDQKEFNENIEGFDQVEPFQLKRDQDIYDDLYAPMYDILSKTITRSNWEIENILKLTNADKDNNVFLDVGSGSGYKVNHLQELGYTAYGVEKSKSMIKRSELLFPDIVVREGDILIDPMLFDKSTFTHVLCMNFTIYEFEDKLQFFRNCYLWMLPNSYLIIHLVDPYKFNAVVPVGKNKWIPDKKKTKGRVTDTIVEFYDFDYHAQYKFPVEKTDNRVIFTEKIKDKKTKNIRQNEQTMYMDSISDVMKMANRAGFLFHGKMNMMELNKDQYQYLYVLERTM